MKLNKGYVAAMILLFVSLSLLFLHLFYKKLLLEGVKKLSKNILKIENLNLYYDDKTGFKKI